MSAARYRVRESTIAMSRDEGPGVAYTVAAGAIVELRSGPLDGDRLVEVSWNGKSVMMFTQDLRSRADLIE